MASKEIETPTESPFAKHASNGEWETVQTEAGDQVEFNEIGDTFVGLYVGYDNIEFEDPKHGPQEFRQLHFRGLDDPENQLYDINAGYRLRQASEKLTPGQVVRIVYVKDLPTGEASDMKEYRIDVRK